MSSDDPFKRLQDHLNQPSAAAPKGRDHYQALAKARFAKLFAAFETFDQILSAKGGGFKFDWTRDESKDSIAVGTMTLTAGGRQVGTSEVTFQGQAVWFHAVDFRKITNRETENGSWTVDEVDDAINGVSSYIIAKTS